MVRRIQVLFSAFILVLLSSPQVSQGKVLCSTNHYFLTHMEETTMHNKDPASMRRYLFEQATSRDTSLEPDEELLALENELRQRQKLYDPRVQWLMEKAALGCSSNKQWARNQLRLVLEADRIEDMRTGDPFRPLAPSQLLAEGDLHLLNQVDGIPWKLPWPALKRGMLVTGPQGAGKTRFIIWLCQQLNAANPPIPWLIIDPKTEFKHWAGHLGALYLDADSSDVSIDLSPPPGLTYQAWLPSLMPQLGEIVGVIYGTDILQQAAQICIELRHQYMGQTRRATEICLEDLYRTVPSVKGASSWRRAGYRDAALTGLSRILSGSGNLFRCRKGIDLDRLFTRNVVLGTRSFTDDFATQFLAFYLLWYLHESERSAPPTNRPKSVLIIDDASRYIGARDVAGRRGLTNLGSILTTLRSSGRCFAAITQIPHLVDPSIWALLHTVVNIGGLHYTADTQLLAKMMGLNEQQRVALMSLGRQEAICLCGGSAWPHAVHGHVPEVPDPVGSAPVQAADLPELKTQPYENLFELIHAGRPSQDRHQPTDSPSATPTTAPATPEDSGPVPGLAGLEKALGIDIVTYLASTVRERQQRLGISARQVETLKGSLLNKELIKEVGLGKALMLAPTRSLYQLLGVPCPYRRNAWDVHSYLVLLAAKLIESDPLVRQAKTEVSIGDTNSTVDLVATLRDGNRLAYEIIHQSVTNISANAAKLEGKGFSKIYFLCLDFNVKERVWAQLRNAGFTDDFLATIDCTIFTALLRHHQKREKNT